MKKFINITIFLFSIFFIGNLNVFAAYNPYTVSAHDVPSDTYIIGTHVFDTNREYLSTEDIMWAARTIEDVESKDDMIIYYKNYDGLWINGRTGENITVPSTFKIEEVNGEEAKGISINTVLEEYEHEYGTGYTSIHEDDYNESGIWLKKQDGITEYKYEVVFDAFNIEDGEYNFDLQCHDYKITEDDYIPTPFNIGTMPQTVTISKGAFRLPIEFDASNINDYVSCAMELEKDEEIIESGFGIGYEDAEPVLNAFAISLTAHEVNGEGIGFPIIFTDYPNNFYDIYSSDIEINELELVFNSRFIEEGDYNVEIVATKDSEEINIDYEKVFLIGEGDDPVYGPSNVKHYLNFDNPLTPGEYEFEITLTDANDEFIITEYVYLTITDEAKMEISDEVWEEPELYYSLDQLVFDNGKKRKFNMSIFTENIPEGTYAIKAKLDYANYVPTPVNFELKYNQNIEVTKIDDIEYFDFSFEIPKTTKVGNEIVDVGHGKYYVELTLHELVEDYNGEMVVSDVPVARTGFYFTINKHINGVWGDISGDGDVLADDTVLLKQAISGTLELTPDQLAAADVNQDNSIDSLDVQIIRRHLVDNITLPYDSGDKYPIYYNLDGGTFEEFHDTVYADIALPLTLINPVKEGYKFIGWTGNNGEVPQINVVIPEGTIGPLSYTANWELSE
ncbi:MAG: hypothetical protein E7166_03685 [Firmicutes bacterium]|nr:hypothetical protein [Bacillota bacterium]